MRLKLSAYLKLSTAILLIASLCSTTSASQSASLQQATGRNDATPPTNARFTVSPTRGVPGKEYDIIIQSANCNDKLNNASLLVPAGSGINATSIKSSDCSLTAKFTIDPDAPLGDVVIRLIDKDGNVFDTVIFAVKEKPPGPVPAGLEPQVDVMWTVMPMGVVKDNFGRKIGNEYYCLEIVIGNNSGYDLQIASVGFELGSAPTATAQTGSLTSQDVPITITGKNLRGAKVLVPESANDKLKVLHVDSDNASDSKITATIRVSPNTPAGTYKLVVDNGSGQNEVDFVVSAKQPPSDLKISSPERRPSESFADTRKIKHRVPSSSYRMTRGSLERGQQTDVRNVTLNVIKSLGPVLTGLVPFFHDIHHRSNFSEGVNIFSNPFEKGFEVVFPDSTIRQLERLDEQMLRDGIVIPNNTQLRTRVFVPKDMLKDLLDQQYRNVPWRVMDALGQLVIIGDRISHLNRIRITSSGETGEVTPPPTVTSVNPLTLTQGETREITLTGNFLDQAKLILPSGITQEESARVGTRAITARVKVEDDAPLGPSQFRITTPGGTTSIGFEIKQGIPVLAKDNAITYINVPETGPSMDPEKDQQVQISISGKHLEGARIIIPKDLETMLQVLEQKGTANKLTATINVVKGTPAKTYKLLVKNDNTESAGADFDFKVNPQPAAKVSDLVYETEGERPPKADPSGDQTIKILLKGANLKGARLIFPSALDDKLILIEEKDKSNERIRAEIRVTKKATAGEYELELKRNDEASQKIPEKFVVAPQAAPEVTLPISYGDAGPPKANPNEAQKIKITIKGKNLGGATLSATPDVKEKVDIATQPKGSGTEVTAEILVKTAAKPGTYNLQLKNTNAGESVDIPIEVKPQQ